MARNGSGTYALPAGNPVETNTVISSVVQNNTMTDIGTALTGSIARDGQSPATANIPMGNNKLTGLATPTTRTDATSLGSIVDGVGVYGATVGGTGNAITVTLAPVLTAYAAGQKFSFIAGAANTGAVTVNLNSVGAKAITKVGTTALVANDILSGSLVEMEYDGTRFQLLSPIGADPTGTYLPLAGGTLTGDLNMSAKSVNTAVHTEAAHATTSDIWTGGNTCLLSGGVVTFTDVVDAPAVGAVREVIANAAHVITDNAALEVDGNANYTCAVGDLLRFEAKTTSTFRVSIVAHGDGGGSGDAKTANPLSQFAATTSAQLAGVISNETGSGVLVFNTSPTLITPALGTPASGVATNLSGTAASLTAGTVTTNANLTGHITSSGNAAVLGSFTSAQLATALTNETGSGLAVFGTSPTLITPVLGTPSSGTVTNLTGTASININGTVGASTPAAATTTTLNTTGAVVFNDAGADVDFRVEGDTVENLLVVDASVDKVGIGTAAPLTRTHILGAGTAVVASGSDGRQEAIIEGANIALTSSFGNLNVISNTAQAADTGGQIAFAGKSTDSDNKYATWGVIKGAKENGTSANIASYLAFSTRANGAGNTEKLRIASDGVATFAGEVIGTGFTGTLDGVLGGGTPAAASVTTLSTTGDISLSGADSGTGLGTVLDNTATGGRSYSILSTANGSALAGALDFRDDDANASRIIITSGGNVLAGSDNAATLGGASNRWSEVFAGNGTINTSDAREKTKVRSFTDNEIAAAKDLSKEIGMFQWLEAVEKKGKDKAREHVGFTVQRAIEIMEGHNLDPMGYGFICYDEWKDEFIDIAAVEAVEGVEEVIEDGVVIVEGVEAVEAQEAKRLKTKEAGNRYAFRYDQLNLFIARGIEARLTALEAK
jgi:hypothetical protein